MVDRSYALPIKGQAKMLGVARRTVYYKLRPVSVQDLKLLRRLDYSIAGARMLRDRPWISRESEACCKGLGWPDVIAVEGNVVPTERAMWATNSSGVVSPRECSSATAWLRYTVFPENDGGDR